MKKTWILKCVIPCAALLAGCGDMTPSGTAGTAGMGGVGGDGGSGGVGGQAGSGGDGGSGAGGDAFGVPADLEDEFIAAAPAYCMKRSECDDEPSGGSVEECVSELRDGIALAVWCGTHNNEPCPEPDRECAYDRISWFECSSTVDCESFSDPYNDCVGHADAVAQSCYGAEY